MAGGQGGARRGAGKPDAHRRAHRIYHDWRVPPEVSADPVLAALADEALASVVDVMRSPNRQSQVRLSAALRLRDEVCGMLAQPQRIVGSAGDPLTVAIEIGLGPRLAGVVDGMGIAGGMGIAREPPLPVPPIRRRLGGGPHPDAHKSVESPKILGLSEEAKSE